jgi:hypothetical protein
MHRYRALLAGAVDGWEIAAGLEAQGMTDGTARRLLHRDVFGLAEELAARAPRIARSGGHGGGPQARERARLTAREGAWHLVPGVLCGSAVAVASAVRLPVVGALLAALVAITTWAALRRRPLRIVRGGGAAGWTYGLFGFALYGPQAATALAGDGPFDPTAGSASFTALALSLTPAAYCAHWFAVRSRAQLVPSHGLSDFADAVRPRLAAALAVYALALAALLFTAAVVAGTAPQAGPAALGLLLFTARLLAVHGRPGPAAAALAAAWTAQALALAAAPARIGPGGATVEAAACGAAALVLTAYAFRALSRASAHRPPP